MSTYAKHAIEAIKSEIKGLELLADSLPADFDSAARAISKLKGRVILSGIGKSGYVGQKISATLASTGTKSFYIHPAEASHGDLGMIGEDDIVMLLSNSGETKELTDIISYCKRFSIPIIAVTMNKDSLLAKNASFLLNIPEAQEASNINAPTTSSTMMMALGDAIAVAIHTINGFTKEDFKKFHPGGKIGASLAKVCDIMHKGNSIPAVHINNKMDNAVIEMTTKGLGCTAIIDNDMHILGVITDGDIRRHMHANFMSDNVADVMTKNPKTIAEDILAAEALAIMSNMSITSLLVARDNKLVGVLHIHDLLRRGVK